MITLPRSVDIELPNVIDVNVLPMAPMPNKSLLLEPARKAMKAEGKQIRALGLDS
jgi:hypothetical protein